MTIHRDVTKNTNHFYPVILVIFFVLFIMIAGWYSVMIPIGEGVDETPHFMYVKYIKENHTLPVQPMSLESGIEVWMGHHPPLYYILGSLSIAWIPTSDSAEVFQPNPHFVWDENNLLNGANVMLHSHRESLPWAGSVLALHVLRFMTICLGSLALYAIYRTAQLLFPGYSWAPLGVVALIGFNPSFIFMSSTVHHDTLQTTIFAFATWWSICFLNRPERKYDTGLAGVLISMALLTKLSGLVLIPVIGITLLLKAVYQKRYSDLPRQILQIGCVMGLIAGWWFVRNQWLYGDPLGWQMFLNIHQHMIRLTPYTWGIFTIEFLGQIERTFWGAFGYMHITFPEITKYFWWLSGLSGIGLLINIWRNRANVRKSYPAWIVLTAILILLFASFVRFSITTLGAGHGRYLFPAGATIGILLITGLNGFLNWRFQRSISIIISSSMLVYAIWLPTTHVFPLYALPKKISMEEVAQIQTLDKPLVEGVQLVGYSTRSSRAYPGENFSLALYWKAVGHPDVREDPRVRIELIDAQENTIVFKEMWPLPSMPPSAWQPEAIYVTETELWLSQSSLPSELFLTVMPLLETGAERIYLKNLLTIGGIDEITLGDVSVSRQEIFAPGLKLLDYQPSSNKIRPKESITVNLYWQVLTPPETDYTVFIHLLNAEGGMVTQFDRPAGGTMNPTSTWQTGQVLRDAYPLSIPPDTSEGIYTIRMGMYTWPSMERIAISSENEIMADKYLDIGSIQIIR